MRLLLIHADHFEYHVNQKAIENPEELTPSNKKGSVDEALVVFSTVEKTDEENPEQVVVNASNSIEEVARSVNARRIVIYPYAHLSSDLGSRDLAIPILKNLEENLKDKGYTALRTPFGWYKSFEIKCKGHPLAELSRSIGPEISTKKEVKVTPTEEETKEYLIVEVNGKEHPLDLKKVESNTLLEGYQLLKRFILSEEIGKIPHKLPPHIKLMRKLELVDYEPASDVGHFRFYPKGTLVKELLEELGSKIAVEQLHAMKIETPVIYRLDQPDIAGQAARFLERNYRFKIDDKDLLLRFAGDFGLFRMMKDVTMSYRQLPVRIYELSKSFRLEQRGECIGLKRMRAFTMPDVHCFCKNLEEGMGEYLELIRSYSEIMNSIGVDYVVAFRVVKDFYTKNKDWFAKLVEITNKPALIELLPGMKHYWILKSEFQAIDSVGGSAQLSTVQLDIEDSERYGIFYVGADGKKKGCIIVHSSVGSIERLIYALLEQAEKMKKDGKPPMFPVWLSPTQVRVIPISGEYVEHALKVVNKLEEHRIRVDIDDRDQTLSSKVREAETEWIPFVVVIGEREAKDESVSVRIRSEGSQRTMSTDELVSLADAEIEDRPRLPINYPRSLRMRPRFI